MGGRQCFRCGSSQHLADRYSRVHSTCSYCGKPRHLAKACFKKMKDGGNSACPNSFFFDLVTPSEIESEILLTPLNKTYGLYSGPIRILKGANHVVSATLAEIMNRRSKLVFILPS